MVKESVYHLDECSNCVHRHVCKYIDKIDKLIRTGTLPLDLSGASCNEYVSEDMAEDTWKDYMEDEEDIDPVVLFENLNIAIGQLFNQGFTVTDVSMSEKTMGILRLLIDLEPDISALILMNGHRIPLRINNSLMTGFFELGY